MPKSGNFSPAFLGSLTPATTQVRQLNLEQIEMLLKGVDFFKGHDELFFSEIN